MLAIILVATVIARRHVHRRAVLRHPPAGAEPAARELSLATLPPEQWTARIIALEQSEEWSQLADELLQVRTKTPKNYETWHLGYLRARALAEADRIDEASQELDPFLAAANPYRDLALHHRAEIADAANEAGEAAHFRQLLLDGYPSSPYRDEAIDDLIEYYSTRPQQMLTFGERLRPSADTARRREIDSREAQVLWKIADRQEAIAKALAVLRGGVADDPGDRAALVLDQEDVIPTLAPADLVLVAQSAASHRHYDRAVELLPLAMEKLPAQRDDLRFQIGRAHYGAERFADAMTEYLRGAAATKDPKAKAQFLHHAARCAQLLGGDTRAEQLATQALAVPGRFPSTSAALMLRLRSRLARHAYRDAASDLAQMRRLFGNQHDLVDASLAYAIAKIGAGANAEGVATIDAVPRKLTTKFEDAELAYWRARAIEGSNPAAAVRGYLSVLRSSVPTHFAYFARERLRDPQLAANAKEESDRRAAAAQDALEKKRIDLARSLQTDAVLLAPQATTPAQLEALSRIYAEIPRYEEIVSLKPAAFPSFPLEEGAPRAKALLAMGLFDDAVDDIPQMYPLRPLQDGLAQSLALNLGAAAKPSIFAIEVVSKSIPSDFVPQLLPHVVQELLYPRYFESYIQEDAKEYGADPRLVLSIMREESRFNPRAKSVAAARGLLQFIITTARDVGRALGIVQLDAEDLYDPRMIIQLGAKYIASLLDEFDGNRYRATAAYNAGPAQTRLWSRLSPGGGNDYFLSTINFDETKDYVRKVQNSYQRYGEIYEHTPPVGGTRPEP